MRDTILPLNVEQVDISCYDNVAMYQLFIYHSASEPEFRYTHLLTSMHEREVFSCKTSWDLGDGQEFRIFKIDLPLGE